MCCWLQFLFFRKHTCFEHLWTVAGWNFSLDSVTEKSGWKVAEKGTTQLCFCPQLPLSEIWKASMSFTQVLLMHWGTSCHRTPIVPKAVGMKTTMVMQFESRSFLKGGATQRLVWQGIVSRYWSSSGPRQNRQQRHCFLQWGVVVHR